MQSAGMLNCARAFGSGGLRCPVPRPESAPAKRGPRMRAAADEPGQPDERAALQEFKARLIANSGELAAIEDLHVPAAAPHGRARF